MNLKKKKSHFSKPTNHFGLGVQVYLCPHQNYFFVCLFYISAHFSFVLLSDHSSIHITEVCQAFSS